jgi:7-cyano-7-deazaguanine synthase
MGGREAAGPAAVVLLSGGLDSATTLALALREGFAAYALTVRYGQRHAVEIERAAELARSIGAVGHRVVDVDLGFADSALTDPRRTVPKERDGAAIASGIPSTYVPARNTVLLAVALSFAESVGARDLWLGVNAVDYSGYPDCRPEFLRAFEALAAVATRDGVEGRGCRIHAPLLHWSKGRIIRTAAELGVDLGRTVSCYDPASDGTPCTACDACRLRARGFLEAGLADPASERKTV